MGYTVLTGLRVSRAGFGGGGIGQVWGPTSEEESVRAVHRALDLGSACSFASGLGTLTVGDLDSKGNQPEAIVLSKLWLASGTGKLREGRLSSRPSWVISPVGKPGSGYLPRFLSR